MLLLIYKRKVIVCRMVLVFAYPQGGVYPYAMTLSGVISPPFENLAGGWYSLQLSDANGCSFDIDSLLLPTVSDLVATIDTNSMTVVLLEVYHQ